MYVLSTCLLYINNNICYQIFILYHFNMIISCMIQVTELTWSCCYIIFVIQHSVDGEIIGWSVRLKVNANAVRKVPIQKGICQCNEMRVKRIII